MNKELEELILKEVPAEDSTSRNEKMILCKEIRRLKPMDVVETGTHRGLTTLYMLTALPKGALLYTADPYDWGQRGNFRKFPELEEKVRFYNEKGVTMLNRLADKQIEFAFIDGFHEKDVVLEEIEALLPKLADGAVVYFHDTNGRNEYCDVPGALEEAGLEVEYLSTENGMAKYVHSSSKRGVRSASRGSRAYAKGSSNARESSGDSK